MTQLGINLPSLIIYLVNFGILLAVLYVLAYKPLLRAIDQRSERISESLAAADRARDEAASSQAAIEEQLNEARREGQRLLDQAKEASDRFREEEMERARQEATSFVERARADIQRERDAAIAEVRVGFGDLAITAAERVIRRSLDRQAHEELIAQVLEEGEPGDSFYFIKAGAVEVVTNKEGQPFSLATLAVGEVFGEVSVLTAQPRTATVVAIAPTELLCFDRRKVSRILMEYPEVTESLTATIHQRADDTIKKTIY